MPIALDYRSPRRRQPRAGLHPAGVLVVLGIVLMPGLLFLLAFFGIRLSL